MEHQGTLNIENAQKDGTLTQIDTTIVKQMQDTLLYAREVDDTVHYVQIL